MTLKDLIVSVKEKNLSKEQLEDYRDELSSLYADMQMEMAELEKKEATYLADDSWGDPSISNIKRKSEWKATDSGKRLIVLKRYCLATKELLNSLKSRIFSQIY